MTYQLRLSARSVEEEKVMASVLILEQNFDEALTMVRKWPDGDDKTHCLAMVYHGLGKAGLSEASVATLTGSHETGTAVRLAEIYAFRGDILNAVRWLERSGDDLVGANWNAPKRRWLVKLQFSPFLRALREDPRWTEWSAEWFELAGQDS